MDKWTVPCDSASLPNPDQDTLLANSVIVLSTREPVDSVASRFGFVRLGSEWSMEPRERGWTGGEFADSISVSGWRAGYGEVGIKVMPEDVQPVDSTDRVMPIDVTQSRFFAAGPMFNGCRLILVWWIQETEREYKSGERERRLAELRSMLEQTRIAGSH